MMLTEDTADRLQPALASEAELLPAIASAYRRLDPANNEVVTATLRQLRQAEPDLLSAPMPMPVRRPCPRCSAWT